MAFFATVWSNLSQFLPVFVVMSLLLPLPYIVAEQLRPAVVKPRWTSYALNIVIGISTIVLSAPIGVAAGMAATALQEMLGWHPLVIPFDEIGAIPALGPFLRVSLLALLPLLLHDLWFYWSHRLEHRVPLLWAFHSLHHSDAEMNCTTWARDHFLQSGWRAFFPVLSLGLLIKLDYQEAGLAAALGQFLFMLWSMFYHSAIRVELPWLDRILVTLQVHRIHHSVEMTDHDRNFADIFPILDMMFGTYSKPQKGAFPATGLADRFLTPGNPMSAQINPVIRALRINNGE